MSILADLKTLLEGSARPYALLYVFALISAVLDVLSVGLVFPLLHLVIGDGEASSLPPVVTSILQQLQIGTDLGRVVVFLIFLFVFKNIFKFLVEYGNAKVTNEIRGRWMVSLYERYLLADFRLFIRTKQGILVHNLFDLTVEALAGLKQYVSFFMHGISTLIVLVALLLISVPVTLATVVALLASYYWLYRPLTLKGQRLGKARLTQYQTVNALPAEAFRGMREVKAYAAESKLLGVYRQAVERMVSLRVAINFYQLLPGLFPEIVLVTVLGIALLSLQASGTSLVALVPLMGTYTYALYRIFQNGSVLMRNVLTVRTYYPSITYLATELRQEADAERESGAVTRIEPSDSLSLHAVSFAYDEAAIIQSVSARFQRGSITAIVGASGAGKSTIANLLIRLVTPTDGSITYGASDITSYALTAWRSHVAVVNQDTFLWHDTIRNNIAFGSDAVTDSSIQEAARRADAHDFISKLPEGYSTVVGEQGARLSGGQKQRIAIARALVRNPDILIFDEATSALDTSSEQSIIETIEHLRNDRIVLVITHRLASVQNADNILVLRDGVLIEEGNHSELLAQKSHYAALWGANAQQTNHTRN